MKNTAWVVHGSWQKFCLVCEYWQSLCLFQVEHSRFHSPPKEKGACSFQSPVPCRCRSSLEGLCPFLCPAQLSRPDLNLTALPAVQQRESLLGSAPACIQGNAESILQQAWHWPLPHQLVDWGWCLRRTFGRIRGRRPPWGPYHWTCTFTPHEATASMPDRVLDWESAFLDFHSPF